jgi:hypothetical protein
MNPGQMMSTDLIIAGVPNKKLVLVGLADQTAVLIFVQVDTRARSTPQFSRTKKMAVGPPILK